MRNLADKPSVARQDGSGALFPGLVGLTPRQKALLLLAAKQRAGALFAAKRRALVKRDQTPLHQVADRHVKAMTVAVMYGFMRGKKAYKSGGINAAVKAVRAALVQSLFSILLKIYTAGGETGIATLRKLRISQLRTLAPLDMRFDVSNPRATKWAKAHALELADGIAETTKDDLRRVIADAVEGDDVDAMRDEILDAVGDEARADMIARTETMTAANEGNREAWDQALEAGLLPEDAKKVWIATSDACPECDELDGEEVGLNEDYSSDGGDGPPLHPNCRCTEGIVN